MEGGRLRAQVPPATASEQQDTGCNGPDQNALARPAGAAFPCAFFLVTRECIAERRSCELRDLGFFPVRDSLQGSFFHIRLLRELLCFLYFALLLSP